MEKKNGLFKIFQIFLLITVILSFFIFVKAYILNDYGRLKYNITWQFPILLALYLDSIFMHNY
jgi:hypothetical protein